MCFLQYRVRLLSLSSCYVTGVYISLRVFLDGIDPSSNMEIPMPVSSYTIDDTSPTSVSRKNLPVKVVSPTMDGLPNTPSTSGQNPSPKETVLLTPPTPFKITITPACESRMKKSDTYPGSEYLSFSDNDSSQLSMRRKISGELKREIENSLLHWPDSARKKSNCGLSSRSTQSLRISNRSQAIASKSSLTLPRLVTCSKSQTMHSYLNTLYNLVYRPYCYSFLSVSYST